MLWNCLIASGTSTLHKVQDSYHKHIITKSWPQPYWKYVNHLWGFITQLGYKGNSNLWLVEKVYFKKLKSRWGVAGRRVDEVPDLEGDRGKWLGNQLSETVRVSKDHLKPNVSMRALVCWQWHICRSVHKFVSLGVCVSLVRLCKGMRLKKATHWL